jgi:putative DNA primase/helicase
MTTLQPPEGVPDWAWAMLARPDGGRWAIPERNASGEVIGTAYRSRDGGKSFAGGGKRGLILPWPLGAYAGTRADDPVFVCEGASDTGALLGLSLDAVGVPMAGACGEMLAELLGDRHVVIVAHADHAGRRGAKKLADAFLTRSQSVPIIEPPDGHKDARAAVIAGANRDSFLALARTAQAVPPPLIDGAPVLLCLADVQSRKVEWLWPGFIARARIALLAGRPGEGKSMASLDWAARVSTGRCWPDGSPCPRGSVLLISCEDNPGDTIRPRLDAHGADTSNISYLEGVQRAGRRGLSGPAPFTLADLPALEQALVQLPDCKLVIIDPIGSFLGIDVDAHRDNEVRALLAPLAALAERFGVAILLVAHVRKGAASHADDLVLGSRAFTGIARSVLHLITDPNDPDRRLLLSGKNNLSKPPPGLAFSITGDPPRIEWHPGTVNLSADEALATIAHSDPVERSVIHEAVEWLRDLLRDGPKAANDVLTEAKAAGFSERTINRARKTAGVKPRKQGFNGGWAWELVASAQERQPDAEDCHTPDAGNLGPKPDECCENRLKIANSDGLAALDRTEGNLGCADADDPGEKP